MVDATEPTQEEVPEEVQASEPVDPHTVTNGCIQAVRSGGRCRLVKIDDKCSCPLDLREEFTVADALRLSKLLYNIAGTP